VFVFIIGDTGHFQLRIESLFRRQTGFLKNFSVGHVFVGIDAFSKGVRVTVTESASRAFEWFQAIVVQILH